MKRQNLHGKMMDIALSRYLPWNENYRGRNDEYAEQVNAYISDQWQIKRYSRVKKTYENVLERERQRKRRQNESSSDSSEDSFDSSEESSSTGRVVKLRIRAYL